MRLDVSRLSPASQKSAVPKGKSILRIESILLAALMVTGCDKPAPKTGISPVVEKVASEVEATANALAKISIIVNYDDEGDLWLTGRGSKNRRTFRTMEELSQALSEVETRGIATIAHVYDAKQGGLLGDSPPRNLKLESAIREQLLKAGFDAPEEEAK